MRTKHILTAMVLPALFAACTADEFTENGSNVNLADRSLLAPITFTVGNGADTRFAWDDEAAGGVGNWTWESTDAFSAFLVDNGGSDPDAWEPTNNLYTNYIYKSTDGSKYETTSQMVEGIYWFYAPAREGDNADSRALMSFALATSQDAEYYKSDAGKVFFTGLYKLVSGDEPQNLPLVLTNYYSRAVFPLTNNTAEDVTIRQIVLQGNKPFVVKGNISTAALVDYMYAFDESGELVPAVNLDNDESVTEKEFREGLGKADIVADDEDKVTSDVIVLDLGDGVTIAKGATETFTMLVPRTDDNVTCTVKILADKGIVEIDALDQSNYARNTQFVHNGVKPMFGLASDNSFKAYSIKKFDEMAENTYYVGSYDDMIALINTVNGEFSVYNLGDWKVDAAMAKALENSDSYVNFEQPVTIEDAKEKVSVTKASFANVTVAKGTVVAFDKSENANAADNAVTETMTIEEGATVELNNGDFTGAAINNAGSLTVNAGATMYTGNVNNGKGVTSTGTLKLVDNPASIDLLAGAVELATEKTTGAEYTTVNGKIQLPEVSDLQEAENNLTITVGKGVTWNVDVNRTAARYESADKKTVYQTNIVNNGTISITNGKTLTLEGDLTNNGEISGEGTLTINGKATNAKDAVIEAEATVGEDAEVANNGEMTSVSNSGTIVTGAGSRTTLSGGEGTVDNTNKAFVDVTNASNAVVVYNITSAIDTKGIADLKLETLSNTYKVNKLVFKAGLTVNEDGNLSSNFYYTSIPAGIKAVDFESGSSINISTANSVLQFNGDDVKVGINSNVTFSGFDATSIMAFDGGAATITVAKNCTFTINYGKVQGNAIDGLEFVSDPLDEGEKGTRGQVVNEGSVTNAAVAYSSSDETNGKGWWTGNDAEAKS